MLRSATPLVLVLVGLGITPMRAADPDDQAGSKLVGSWKLVAAKYDGEDSDLPQQAATLKHITPTHFSFATYDAETGMVLRTMGGT